MIPVPALTREAVERFMRLAKRVRREFHCLLFDHAAVEVYGPYNLPIPYRRFCVRCGGKFHVDKHGRLIRIIQEPPG